ncbi:multiple epidermal growth factor-like domains protein 11 isoform X2 [Mya arenaria]|uniref:multiple epidermal growth factor-like domains protein 11 isoform X2 n=1 Tax=Mya arenaria TaxID=6604 RepID=UPI0022E901BA|nr:multiple epidermal growth factor-like domains protein 11 isoform X2 [Mya arenaria]
MTKMIPGKMVTFAVLCMLVRVVCTQECSTCQCCADGIFHKCSSRGYCNYGCIDGYYGEKCNYECTSQNCLSCDRHHGKNCLKCISGYFLRNYTCYECGSQCQSCSSYGCNSCSGGYWGNTCDAQCMQNCASCNKYDGHCLFCESGYYVYYRKCTTCGYHCAECGSSGCTSCHDGYWGSTCNEICGQNCASCSKSDGNCLSCSSGYWGNTCEKPCGHHCLACDERNGRCLSCEHGYLGHPCTECRRDMCINQFDCDLCSNISFYAKSGVCCLCSLDNCVSCSKALDTVKCKICKQGYYPQINGQCELCNSYCFKNECDSFSGECLHGCINGYWNKTCDTKCEPECLSCNQADGSCSHCKNTSKYGPNCRSECSNTCKNSKCDNNENCMNGCIQNTFGEKCENKCDGSCSPKDNRTSCSEKTGMCLYGCQTRYKGKFCPKDVGNRSEKQTTLKAALGCGLGVGIMTLIVLAIIAVFWFRKRRRSNTERNNSLHDARKDYDTVDANFREAELNELRYEALQGTGVHTMDQTTYYSNVAEKQNVHGGSLSD